MALAKEKVIAIGETVHGGAAKLIYSCQHWWDYEAILHYMQDYPKDEFTKAAMKAGYGNALRKVKIQRD